MVEYFRLLMRIRRKISNLNKSQILKNLKSQQISNLNKSQQISNLNKSQILTNLNFFFIPLPLLSLSFPSLFPFPLFLSFLFSFPLSHLSSLPSFSPLAYCNKIYFDKGYETLQENKGSLRGFKAKKKEKKNLRIRFF